MKLVSFPIPAAFGLLAFIAIACGTGNAKNGQNNPVDQTMSVLDPTCGIETKVDTTPTYAEVVAPIMMKNCAQCHRGGGIAPFPLLTYEEVKPLAGLIAERTTAREMPPYNPNNCGHCNTFKDAAWLTSEEIAIIAAWAEAGAPSGDLAKAPMPPGPPAGLAEATATWKMAEPYTPSTMVSDDYRCFVVDPNLATDQFVTGYEVVPGDSRVVHHVIAYMLESDQAQTAVEALDAQDAAPGYQCYGGPGAPSRLSAAWAPGVGATRYPTDTGLLAPAKRKFVMQIHYNVANGAFPDQTAIKVSLAPTVKKIASIEKIAMESLTIPPGQSLHKEMGTFPVPANAGVVTIWGVAPHMHQTGKTLTVTSQTNGQTQCLVDVGNWDFHWQSFNFYETPITVNGGDPLTITCGYDSTGRKTTTTLGEGTEDEMCLAFFYVTR